MDSICVCLSGLSRGHAFRTIVRSALVTAGHLNSSDSKIQTGVVSRFLSCIQMLDLHVQDLQQERKQHALVCDRLNNTLYKINIVCILYTGLVFPTLEGKSL